MGKELPGVHFGFKKAEEQKALLLLGNTMFPQK